MNISMYAELKSNTIWKNMYNYLIKIKTSIHPLKGLKFINKDENFI